MKKFTAQFVSPHEIMVVKGQEGKIYKSKNFVLATGSRPDVIYFIILIFYLF